MKKKCLLALFLIYAGNISLFSTDFSGFTVQLDKEAVETPSLSGFWNLTGSPILIDDTDPLKNWSYTVATYPWASGSGTWNDPYQIENVTMDGSGIGVGVEVKNSSMSYFVLRNMTITSFASGIKLYNTTNGLIQNNTVTINSDSEAT